MKVPLPILGPAERLIDALIGAAARPKYPVPSACQNCLFIQDEFRELSDNGYCYMWKEQPEHGYCAEFRQDDNPGSAVSR